MSRLERQLFISSLIVLFSVVGRVFPNELVKLPELTKEEKDSSTKKFINWMQKKPFQFKFSGAIRLDAFFDTRQANDFWHGIDFNSPKPQKLDPNNCDINDKAQFNIVPWPLMQVDVFGPDVWGAKSSALIKADIVGRTLLFNDVEGGRLVNSYGLPRIRHSYFQLDWEKTSLRSGLYYHPLAMIELAPDTVSVDGGEMFDPFNYSIMFQLRHKFSAFELVTALGRIAYRKEARDSISPHFYLRLNAFIGDQMICIGNDFRTWVPRLETDLGYKDPELILGFVPFIAARFEKDDFLFKTRFTYAENAALLDLIGGYAVCAQDESTDRRRYTRMRSWSYWIDTMHITKKERLVSFLGTPRIWVHATEFKETQMAIYLFLDSSRMLTTWFAYSRVLESSVALLPLVLNLNIPVQHMERIMIAEGFVTHVLSGTLA